MKSKDRLLRGAMRVGLVAKGLILKGDQQLELVLLCAAKPTVAILKDVAEKLSAQLEVERSADCWSFFPLPSSGRLSKMLPSPPKKQRSGCRAPTQ